MNFNRTEFWKDPDNSDQPQGIINICRPEFYLNLTGITGLIVDTLKKYVLFDDSIVELGCGTGRNLAGLKGAGFENLFGIDISEKAIQVGRDVFPLLENITIECSAVEDTIKKLSKCDCIFTQGFLQHLPPDIDWIHKTMTMKARKVIMIIENERPHGERSWARDYKKIFMDLGWIEVDSKINTNQRGHSPTTALRVFCKQEIL